MSARLMTCGECGLRRHRREPCSRYSRKRKKHAEECTCGGAAENRGERTVSDIVASLSVVETCRIHALVLGARRRDAGGGTEATPTRSDDCTCRLASPPLQSSSFHLRRHQQQAPRSSRSARFGACTSRRHS